MSKLYVAKMVMIKPLFFYGNGAVKVITDDILVKKTAFGYKETLTGRSFKKGTYLKKNEGTYNCVSAPYILTDSSIAQKLEAPVKSVDNAIQRIRKKASKNIMTED